MLFTSEKYSLISTSRSFHSGWRTGRGAQATLPAEPESPLSQGAAPNDCPMYGRQGLFGNTELRLHYQLGCQLRFMYVIYFSDWVV